MPGLVAAVALLIVATACSSGHSCSDLESLRGQRDAARQAASKALQLPPGPDREKTVDRAHDRAHQLGRAVYDLEQSCR